MAVRTPLKFNFSTNNLEEMESIDIAYLQRVGIREYGLNPSVTLSVSASGGNLSGIDDTRYTLSEAGVSGSAFVGAGPSVLITAATYQTITKTYETLSPVVDSDNRAFPVYYSGGNIYAMTLQDMYDTFVDPAITSLTSAPNGTGARGGTYLISTSLSEFSATLVSATPVFTDTRIDPTVATSINLPEATDQPVVITDYYLHIIDAYTTAPTTGLPLYITADNHLKVYSTAEWTDLITNLIRYYATQPGSQIDYNITTSSTGSRGTGMDNTHLTGVTDTTYNQQVGSLYYSQTFPSGTPATITTTYLQCVRV